jgi:hypothetical protein
MSEFVKLLPVHKGGLSLDHNPHVANYESVEQWESLLIDCGSVFHWVDDEQRNKSVATNEVWDLHWYPDTPIGSHRLLACDLEVLLKAARDWEEEGKR